MKIKKLAQNTILITLSSGKTILIDPGKYNLDPDKYTIDSFPIADFVFITHKHADHYDLELLKAMLSKKDSIIFTNNEINGFLSQEGINSTVVSIGDEVSEAGFIAKIIRTDHVVRDELIINFGIVFSADNSSFYHTSDTRYIDPSLLPKDIKSEVLFVPISNRGVVMGIDDALVFSSELKPKLVIPMHYDSPKDKDRVNPDEFKTKANLLGLNVRILSFGEEITL
jgi:L-ascorbate metabolism protein UlaG (beta-lactamase superfamily)